MIRSKRIYSDSAVGIIKEEESEEDWLNWTRSNNSHTAKREIIEVKKNIQKQLNSFKINKEFGLSKAAQMMLERSEEFEFDIFELLMKKAPSVVSREDLWKNISKRHWRCCPLLKDSTRKCLP